MNRLRVCLAVESGTDVRLVDGLAACGNLEMYARRLPHGREVSWPPSTGATTVHCGPPERLRFARWLHRALRRRRADFDAVVVQGYGLAALAANVAHRWTRVRTVMLVCSPIEAYYTCRRFADSSKPFRSGELTALKAVARVNARIGQTYVVLSDYLREVVRSHGTRRPIAVIPVYGVDTTVFNPSREPKARIRQRLGLPSGGQHLFFGSRIAPEKDAAAFLDAASAMVTRGRDVRVVHCSGGYREFAERAAGLGLTDRVVSRPAVFPGRELADYYRAADLCVQASREEGLGFMPLEALACEAPVVATGVGGLRETIGPTTGWTYPVGDPDALRQTLEDALDDPDEGRRRARSGREMVCARFERSYVFDRFAQVLAEGTAS